MYFVHIAGGRKATAVLAAVFLLLPGLSSSASEIPEADELGEIGAVTQTVDNLLEATTLPFALEQQPQQTVKIALVSTGVDLAALPQAVHGRFVLLGNPGDAVGRGTHAASVILEAAPGAQITSIGVYPNGKFNPAWQAAAFDWLVANAAKFHAVLYAVDPREFLDPISASMAAGEWEAMSDAVADTALPGSAGPVYGLPLSASLRAKQTAEQPYYRRAALERFAYLNNRWLRAVRQIDALTAAGVAVVSPAGDDGPNPQSIEGIANLPNVVTVGGHNGAEVSPAGSSGPSIDGKVKPDLIAPTGVAGVLPEASQLARSLAAKGRLDPDLALDWPFPPPPSKARARLDSTASAAALVAASMAGMAADGVGGPAVQRGALTAASVPIDGVAVWRQGAGLLRQLSVSSLARSRPLALAHGDLAAEPESGPWSARVPFSGGAATAASASSTDLITVGPDARNQVLAVSPGESPPVSAKVDEQGVSLSVPAGDGSYRGGLYCGYSQVSIPATGGEVDAQAEINGIPAGTEQVPTCLLKGTQLTAKSFYIHDTDAENLTFGLLPSLPPGASVLDHALMLLPVDPLATKLFFKVTKFQDDAKFGPGTYARFPNVPPGYYKVRQWSDYGAPVTETRLDAAGKPVTVERDLGEKAGYQSFPALVMGAVCTDEPGDPQVYGEHGLGSPCTRSWLQSHLDAVNSATGSRFAFEYEKPTGGYLVNAAGSSDPAHPLTVRVIFDFVKKMPGAGVASRYIDLIDCADLNFGTFDVSSALSGAQVQKALGAEPIDACKPASAPSLGPVSPAGKLVLSSGIAWYPFNLTTPNYKAGMSLNFSYRLTNAFIVPVVIVGNDVNWGVVSPAGRFALPASTPRTPLNLGSLPQPWGQADGKARFDFKMLPRGVSKGLLAFVVVPANNTAVSAASIDQISFELDTWTNALWPATTFAGVCNSACGHSFSVSSNLNRDPVKAGTWQIQSGGAKGTPACRSYPGEAAAPTVCEDWTVMVHSPGDDAATFDVADSGRSVVGETQAAGSKYFDPLRGVHDFSSTLVIPNTTIAGFEAGLKVPFEFKTDGRHWEQLTVTTAVNAAHPGPLEFRIMDNIKGRDSALFSHVRRESGGPVSGAVQLAAYHPFESSADFLKLP